MSNVLGKLLFYTVPTQFVDSGSLRDLSPSAVKLYNGLCYFAQKHTAVKLQFSNAELRDYVGLDPKSIQSARERLRKAGLIVLEKGPVGVYSYILCDPITGERLPPPEGRKGVKRYCSPEKTADTASELIDPTSSPKPESSMPPQTPRSQETGPNPPFRCYTCRGTHFWIREGNRVCSRCHPEPSHLTAKDVGFG
jgi:hypothetical protein